MTEGAGVSVVEALRPDGTTRRFAFGSVTAQTTKNAATAQAAKEQADD
jgi:hypothetical protein